MGRRDRRILAVSRHYPPVIRLCNVLMTLSLLINVSVFNNLPFFSAGDDWSPTFILPLKTGRNRPYFKYSLRQFFFSPSPPLKLCWRPLIPALVPWKPREIDFEKHSQIATYNQHRYTQKLSRWLSVEINIWTILLQWSSINGFILRFLSYK